MRREVSLTSDQLPGGPRIRTELSNYGQENFRGQHVRPKSVTSVYARNRIKIENNKEKSYQDHLRKIKKRTD